MQNVKKTYKLFLDDIRYPKDAYAYTGMDMFWRYDWIIVRNYEAFTEFIKDSYHENNAFPDMISFDHDLADEHYMPQNLWGDDYNEWSTKMGFKEKTGMDCAKWLVDFCMDNEIRLCNYYCHSMNPTGRENIISLLDNFKKHQDVYNNK